MAIVVIGGQSRNIGKTAVVCGLIAAMAERRWTAIKITQCKHADAAGESCDCELAGRSWAVSEERDTTTGTDSSRYLAAGATRSLWVRTLRGRLGGAMARIHAEIGRAENAILESNSVLQYLKPDLYISVLDAAVADVKPSARRYLGRADAVVICGGPAGQPSSPCVSAEANERVPRFRVERPGYCSPELVLFVAQKLQQA